MWECNSLVVEFNSQFFQLCFQPLISYISLCSFNNEGDFRTICSTFSALLSFLRGLSRTTKPWLKLQQGETNAYRLSVSTKNTEDCWKYTIFPTYIMKKCDIHVVIQFAIIEVLVLIISPPSSFLVPEEMLGPFVSNSWICWQWHKIGLFPSVTLWTNTCRFPCIHVCIYVHKFMHTCRTPQLVAHTLRHTHRLIQ